MLVKGEQDPHLEVLRSFLEGQGLGPQVCTAAREIEGLETESVVILVLRAEDFAWLNGHRPVWKRKKLRGLIFAEGELHSMLAQEAPDFSDWISHVVEALPRLSSSTAPALALVPAAMIDDNSDDRGAVKWIGLPRFAVALVERRGPPEVGVELRNLENLVPTTHGAAAQVAGGGCGLVVRRGLSWVLESLPRASELGSLVTRADGAPLGIVTGRAGSSDLAFEPLYPLRDDFRFCRAAGIKASDSAMARYGRVLDHIEERLSSNVELSDILADHLGGTGRTSDLAERILSAKAAELIVDFLMLVVVHRNEVKGIEKGLWAILRSALPWTLDRLDPGSRAVFDSGVTHVFTTNETVAEVIVAGLEDRAVRWPSVGIFFSRDSGFRAGPEDLVAAITHFLATQFDVPLEHVETHLRSVRTDFDRSRRGYGSEGPPPPYVLLEAEAHIERAAVLISERLPGLRVVVLHRDASSLEDNFKVEYAIERFLASIRTE